MDTCDIRLETRSGHVFSHTTASGNSRVHLGDVYNYQDSDFAQKRILDWLTPIDPSKSHNQAWKQFQKGTLSWFLGSDRFQDWCHLWEQETPWILWCHGTMGTGKTTMVGQAVTHLQSAGIPRGDLAVVYCRYSDQKSQTTEYILGSILSQLYQRDGVGFDIPSSVESSFNQHAHFRTIEPNLIQLSSWMRERLQGPTQSPVFVLLDALDELDASTRRELLALIKPTLHGRVRLLVTSRDVPEDDHILPGCEQVEYSTHKEDLQTLVHAKLHEEGNRTFRQLISDKPGGSRPGRLEEGPCFETLEEEILVKVIKSSNNMYVLRIRSAICYRSLISECLTLPGSSMPHCCLTAFLNARSLKTSTTTCIICLRTWILSTTRLGKERPATPTR